jgi:carboxymethylenebutenolidase
LGIFASQDQWITPQVVKQFEANMDSVGKKTQVKMFEADHAFANPSNPKYLQTYADEARKLTLRYLQRKLKTDKKRKKKEVL